MSHFTALLLYAFFASVVFGVTQRSAPNAMIRFGALCFAGFIAAAVVVSWGMYFIKQ